MADSTNNSIMSEVQNIIRSWEDENAQPNYDPVPSLTRLAEIIELETDNYYKLDPDPFDERHPSRTDPDGKLGQILKTLFKKDHFMTKLVNDYLRDTYYSRQGLVGNVDLLNTQACRLMLDIMPGLETTVVFQSDQESLILRLIKWATNSSEPLQSYSTGLLAAAMEIPEVASKFREQNSRLVPLILKRLNKLRSDSNINLRKITKNGEHENTSIFRPFAHLSTTITQEDTHSKPGSLKRSRENGSTKYLDLIDSPANKDKMDSCTPRRKKARLENGQLATPVTVKQTSPGAGAVGVTETSNSSWAEMESFVIGTVQIHPITDITKQILALRYLTPMGEYQEFLGHVFEQGALQLILAYLNVRETKEARLGFEASKYLAALLCHKKVCLEFINQNGLQALLDVPRPSIAATGVSVCIYYLGYCEEVMEKICLSPKYIISNLVSYCLWLVECAHDSGKCHAIMFFGLTFQFKVILDEFDAQDGLRKLHNVVATLSILSPDSDTGQVKEDTECSHRQIVRHCCMAYKKYLEAHLYLKMELLTRSQLRPERNAAVAVPTVPSYKALKPSQEEIQQYTEHLLHGMMLRSHWGPVDQLVRLGCVTQLLVIIALAYEWISNGRAETVRSALDVLAIACVMPKVQLLFCEKIDLPDQNATVGMNIILGAAEGEIVADADVQKSALRVIVNCVCGPINRIGGQVGRFSAVLPSPNKKTKLKSSEELMQKVWDCVRQNSGIMVLLQLMNVKTPITDADCIRTLACKALAGLARSETVRQIVSKLPLITSGQLHALMKDPILQEKRQEHVTFQKYGLELMQRILGNTKFPSGDMEASLAKMHRGSVVAQTKIQFNEQQLLQLIHQHFMEKGLLQTANELLREANITPYAHVSQMQQPRFRFSSTLTPNRSRSNYLTTPQRSLMPPSATPTPEVSTPSNVNNQIKLIKKSQSSPFVPSPMQNSNSRLQKLTNTDPTFWALPGHSLALDDPLKNQEPARITLNSIVTEYLANQHALCKNPMATCPQFNLFVPHKCPDPKPKIALANNLVIRTARRAIGYQSKFLDRKFVHSKFLPVQTIRSKTDEGFFTVASFMPQDHNTILVGDYYGEIHSFNLNTGNEEGSFQAHDNYIVHLQPNRMGNLLLTSSTWGQPMSAMWHILERELKHSYDDEEYVEYSKLNQDKVIGTRGENATIYDVTTGQEILKFKPTISNQYTKNKATFSPQDDLVLSDGVIFDVASGKQIHKLDKLNQMQSGVFHPNGLEIVSNSEVWDIRTFHLLKTVPSLNQCNVAFSPNKNVIYAHVMEQEMDDGDSKYDSSFKTVDAFDYSSIATIDVKKNIYDLCVNNWDTQIALVENWGMYQSVQESAVRIYDVGRRRDDEDEQEEEDEEDEELGSDDDGSENDDSVVFTFQNNDNEEENNDNGNEEASDDSDVSWSTLSSNGSDDDSEDDGLLGEILFDL